MTKKKGEESSTRNSQKSLKNLTSGTNPNQHQTNTPGGGESKDAKLKSAIYLALMPSQKKEARQMTFEKSQSRPQISARGSSSSRGKDNSFKAMSYAQGRVKTPAKTSHRHNASTSSRPSISIKRSSENQDFNKTAAAVSSSTISNPISTSVLATPRARERQPESHQAKVKVVARIRPQNKMEEVIFKIFDFLKLLYRV